MFSITQYGSFKHMHVLIGYVDGLYTTTILSQIHDKEEGERRMLDNSAFHTTLYDPTSQFWWSIYSSKSVEKTYPIEIPCQYITLFDTDGQKFPYSKHGIPTHVWQHIVGMFLV